LRRTAHATAIITFASHEANAPILTPDIPAMIAAATTVLLSAPPITSKANERREATMSDRSKVPDRIDLNGLNDVPELPLTPIDKLCRDFTIDEVVCSTRETNAAGLGDCFEPGRNIDALAEDVVAFDDHVADIDPNAKTYSSVLSRAVIEPLQQALNAHRTLNRGDDRGKLEEHRVAGDFDCAPAMPSRQGRRGGLALAQSMSGAFLIDAHQPAVSDDVCGDDDRKLSFDARHGARSDLSFLPQLERWAPHRRTDIVLNQGIHFTIFLQVCGLRVRATVPGDRLVDFDSPPCHLETTIGRAIPAASKATAGLRGAADRGPT
jgi:hypothetical protein